MRLSLPALLLLAVPAFAAGPQFEEEPYGKTADGKAVTLYTLVNRGGSKAKIITYGGILTELHVPDKTGKLADVVLGFDKLEGYTAGHPYFGANAGRVVNRIAKGKFSLDGKDYQLPVNDGSNSLHGGKEGFDKKIWRAEGFMGVTGPGVRLFYESKDMEEGYPGKLSVQVSYTLTNDNELRIDYSATTDKTTICNIAHHSYFNLAGHNSGKVLDHVAQFAAQKYTISDANLIPTGEIAPVAGTPYDFTVPTAIGKRIAETPAKLAGYDLNYVLDGTAGGVPFKAATVTEAASGRVMEVYTTEPGLQFYTSNFLNQKNGKGGAAYGPHGAFCLEAQKYPDAINKLGREGWASPVLMPGEEYRQTTVYRFGVAK